ncbi:enoyl-CoA hydratase-related protein [Nocardioides sp. R-C-SC26]|uniref:enoyl-CoA hydratase-related protein n=1 Tax=Nocardioides sp. R-C-SC26 TaxID=2870414 RepID=UPI001E2A359C|nr:enoyl-CoA hydratase-related protein [Nocardioides sp. R-C-SC26]
MTSDLDVRLTDGALWLTMNRPEVFNALSGEMCVEMTERIRAAGTDDDVRVVVLTGSGAAFSTGADISGENAIDRFDVRAMDAANGLIRAIVECPRPVLAAVNGVAAGVGASAALAADIIVATESASFLLAFARIGFMPDGGTSTTVAAAIGRARAMRMALLAEPLGAREAHDCGLITHVAPDTEYADLAATLVRRLAAGAPLAQTATKRTINAATLTGLEDALERERSGQTLLMRTADAREGMNAFNERRKPVFRGE